MDHKKNIEQQFKEQFQAYQPDPSAEVWTKISRNLKWKNFMRPRWNNFNIVYLSGFVFTTVILLALNSNNKIDHSIEKIPEALSIGSTEINANGNVELSTMDESTVQTNSEIGKSTSNSELKGNNSSKGLKDTRISKNNSNPLQESGNTEINNLPTEDADNSGFQSIASLPPRAFYVPSSLTGCVPLHVSFTNLSSEADEYSWSFGDGGQSNEQDPEYIFDEAGEYIITLTAKNSNEELSVYQNIITVNEVPQASFMIDKDEAQEESISVYFYNYSQGAEYYSWDFGDGSVSTATNPSHFYESRANYNILLKAISNEGCIDTMMLRNALNRKDPVIKIPNAFSPNTNGPNGGYFSNGENKNEIFHPFFEEAPVEYQLRIFNRNGNLIFETIDMNIGWDGYYMQQLQPRGVYIYKLKVKFENSEYIVRMGDITIFIQD